MPTPTKPPARKVARTEPLTVDASKEVSVPEAAEVAPPANTLQPQLTAEQREALEAMSADNDIFKVSEDGSVSFELEHPVEILRFGVVGRGDRMTSITLRRCLWKDRRAAARLNPPDPTPLDHDASLASVLSGWPVHILDELDARDFGMVQMALGKLLYSPRMISGS